MKPFESPNFFQIETIIIVILRINVRGKGKEDGEETIARMRELNNEQLPMPYCQYLVWKPNQMFGISAASEILIFCLV